MTVIAMRKSVLDAYNNEVNNDEAKALDDFSVDIKVDKDKSIIQISDNGYGIPEEEFPLEMSTEN